MSSRVIAFQAIAAGASEWAAATKWVSAFHRPGLMSSARLHLSPAGWRPRAWYLARNRTEIACGAPPGKGHPAPVPPCDDRQGRKDRESRGDGSERPWEEAQENEERNGFGALSDPSEIVEALLRNSDGRQASPLGDRCKCEEARSGSCEREQQCRGGEGVGGWISQCEGEGNRRVEEEISATSRNAPRSVGPDSRATAPSRPSKARFTSMNASPIS
jgi:hypothetical protein